MGRWRRIVARVARRRPVEHTPDRDLGFVRPGELGRVVVVSPHLGDAVLSVGDLLAAAPGATVLGVFAGPGGGAGPPTALPPTRGPGTGDDVAAVRRAEDERALGRLGAHPVHLPFVGAAHRSGRLGPPPDPADLTRALDAAIRAARPTAVLVPLAVGHPEHRIVADALTEVRATFREPSWIAYAEIPHLAVPGALAGRLAEVVGAGTVLEPLVPPVDPMARARKVAAVEAYTSQVGPLDDRWGLRRRVRETPESLWRITT